MLPRRRLTEYTPLMLFALLAGAIGLGLMPGAAVAQAPAGPEANGCVVGGPEVEAACTALIEKGGLGPQELANAHARRGEFYRSQRKFDEAFADFAEAL